MWPEDIGLHYEGSYLDESDTVISTYYVGREPPGDASPVPTLVKGCESQFAIESCRGIRVSTLHYFRDRGGPFIRDEREGRVRRQSVRKTRNRPEDIAQSRTRNDAYNRGSALLAESLGSAVDPIGLNVTRLKTDTSSETRTTDSISFGGNGRIFCASLEPADAAEWAAWRAKLDARYDHTSYIHSARDFARALAEMAAKQTRPRRVRGDNRTALRRCSADAALP